jgi:hypothetical protein
VIHHENNIITMLMLAFVIGEGIQDFLANDVSKMNASNNSQFSRFIVLSFSFSHPSSVSGNIVFRNISEYVPPGTFSEKPIPIGIVLL